MSNAKNSKNKKEIDYLKKGKRPTLLNTKLANRVIEICNAIIGATVSPYGAGKFVLNGDKLVLVLNDDGGTLKIRVAANGGLATRNFVIAA